MLVATIFADPSAPDPKAPFRGVTSYGIEVHGETPQDAMRRLADAIDDQFAGLDTPRDIPIQHFGA